MIQIKLKQLFFFLMPAGAMILAPSVLAADNNNDVNMSQLRNQLASGVSVTPLDPEVIRKSPFIASALAKYEWLDVVAEANPSIVAAIASHKESAKLLAEHRHLGKIAAVDPYLCRRLTRWDGATKALIRNPHFDKVIALDPQGMYVAMSRKPAYARLMAKQPMFYDLALSDPNMTNEIQKHME